MKFLTLTRIAALLATSGLASARIDVCAGGVQLACDRKAAALLKSLDSMPPLTAFRAVRRFLESNCNGACLSSELKAELCEKAHSIKPLIKAKIYLEDIEQCFGALNGEQESCHVSYQCPPGTPEGNICVTNSCILNGAAAAQAGPQAMSATKKGDNCYISYKCPPGTPAGNVCVSEICDSLPPPDSCIAAGETCLFSDLLDQSSAFDNCDKCCNGQGLFKPVGAPRTQRKAVCDSLPPPDSCIAAGETCSFRDIMNPLSAYSNCDKCCNGQGGRGIMSITQYSIKVCL